MLLLSIVVPTFNEGRNVEKLVDEIDRVLSTFLYEIVFVDDSTDSTPEILKGLTLLNPHIQFEHREHERGLATAVVRGFQLAHGKVITVMDADLQHPPELLIEMFRAIESGADIVIPSRFISGGSDGGLNIFRKVVSATARHIGKTMIRSLRPISDPTSGFFMFRYQVIEQATLKPIGWKILIEIIVRGRYQKVIEIPYKFQAREVGKSKMSIKEQWNYLVHLIRLVKDVPEDRRFYIFAIVGFSGVLVNQSLYMLLVSFAFNVSLAGAISAITAMLTNFYLNNRFTWSDAETENIRFTFMKFVATSLVGIVIDISVLTILFNVFHINYLLANLVGIVFGMAWNYLINKKWTWRKVQISHLPVVIKWTNLKF
ncbi:glycosyltransferase [Desulfosporosinus fructosivorans]